MCVCVCVFVYIYICHLHSFRFNCICIPHTKLQNHYAILFLGIGSSKVECTLDGQMHNQNP